MNVIAICKDCGNGTLNGKTNPQFDIDIPEDDCHSGAVYCLNCNSAHVDVVSISEEGE